MAGPELTVGDLLCGVPSVQRLASQDNQGTLSEEPTAMPVNVAAECSRMRGSFRLSQDLT